MMDAALSTAANAPPFERGDPAPWFAAATPSNPKFHFSTSVGYYVLLGFLPSPGPAREEALADFMRRRALFDDKKLTSFLVIRDPAAIAAARNEAPGLRWFLDEGGSVSRLYGAVDEAGAERSFWLLLDPTHRVLNCAPTSDAASLFDDLERLPAIGDHAGVELYAPVLIIPRVFEPDLCRKLIALYETEGGSPSGVMRDVDGRTVGVLDDFKKRRDLLVSDPDLQRGLLTRISRRVVPEIAKVYQFAATRLERYLVACYDAADGGYFRPHRDNETLGTAHRKFAVSINLNAEEFTGGDLRFPEFGPRTYRPPTGGAVVFACGLQHEATPVTQGRRYAFLPFLYDEAGQAVREANQSKLDVG